MRQRGVERGGRLDQMSDDIPLLRRGEFALLEREVRGERGEHCELTGEGLGRGDAEFRPRMGREQQVGLARHAAGRHIDEIGRASSRGRGCLYVWVSVWAVGLKKKKREI